MTLSELIISYRKSNDISQRKFAEICGLSNGYISMLEKNENPKTRQPIKPTLSILNKLSRGMNMNLNTLLTCVDELEILLDDNPSGVALPPPNITKNYTTFPVIGEVAAGYDCPALEDWEGETVDIPEDYLKGRSRNDFFVLKVKGDSMYPAYQDGDKVLILRQTTLNHSGQVGVVIYNDDLGTLKRIEYKNGEDWMKLVPINPAFPPVRIENEELEHCRVLGIPKLLIREIEE